MCMDAAVSMKCRSPTLNKSSVIWCFDVGDALKICHKIFGFYPGLPHDFC